MATEADVLRSISAILEGGERREQRKVQSALAMMQFAQQKRMSDIAETKSNLELAQKSLQQQKPIVASEFLSATRLGGIYQQTEEGETAEDVAARLKSIPVTMRSGAVNDFFNMMDGSTDMTGHYPHVEDHREFAMQVLKLLGEIPASFRPF